MTELRLAHLKDRSVLRVSGDDHVSFLQGLVTNDMDRLQTSSAVYAGLLTPQGKILFAFFLVRDGNSVLIDTVRDSASDLVKRLMFYRLRAKVEIEDVSDEYAVLVAWGGKPTTPADVISYLDPRLADLGHRMIAPLSAMPTLLEASGAASAETDDYHVHRISQGVPEAGRDFEHGDTFPHEACFDQLAGVDFEKGCFVGQEVVSRMQHRANVRKRIIPVHAEVPLPASGADIIAGTAKIGTLGSMAGENGLALVRLDRAREALGKGDALTVGDVPIRLIKPAWAKFDVPDSDPEPR